ncbi:MAG: peptidoglycan DD-metalloendopeptidase family protein [Flavobacterium sp.]|uniref:peptidoglycan DD-metalloendopeptidase family protein n=1 Tax=Flavobacterium sp. TaxID=239 RepID=UPI00326349BB
MKKTVLTLGFSFFLLAPILSAQNKSANIPTDYEDYSFPKNDTENPCITIQEYALLNSEVNYNLKKLALDKIASKNILTTSLLWPLKLATGFTQCEYHFIGAYVDQNTATTTIQDYNCGTNTYDGHHGTDIAIWPYSLYKMDNSQIEVVAAAAGTIVQKADGNFDRNCGSNTLTANSIIIQHADGSCALYWHMKNGAVTTKTVGQTVAAGEKIGVVGSSGSSSGPHLHFEVWAGSTNTTYKDPFSGACNLLNATSWWTSQRPHTEPAIMKASVHPTDMTLATCPNSDVPNESDTFVVPFQGPGLAPGYAKFYFFWREIPASASISLRILNPNGSVFNNWSYTVPTNNKVSYYGSSKLLPTTDGIYTFEASYNGVACSKTFTITHTLGISDSDTNYFKVYPNPTNDNFLITANGIENGNYSFALTNSIGQIIKTEKSDIENNKLEKSFSVIGLSKGIYFLTIQDSKSKTVKKILKNN